MCNLTLPVLKLTVGFESNLERNIKKPSNLIINNLTLLSCQGVAQQFKNVEFTDVSIGFLVIFSKNLFFFFKKLDDLHVSEPQTKYCAREIRNILIVTRASYYRFCRRNKEWIILFPKRNQSLFFSSLLLLSL